MTTGQSSPHATTTVTGVVEPLESEILSSQCRRIVDQMDNGSSNVCIWSKEYIIKLFAIFQRGRTACLSGDPRLFGTTKAYVLDKLLTHPPFQLTLFELRRYITLLVEVLRSFRDEDRLITIEHITRNVWYYEGIKQLDCNLKRIGRGRSRDLDIEWWDAVITLQHCQYILLSMVDSVPLPDHLIESGRLVIKGTLQGDISQYNNAKDTLDNTLKVQRLREPWHDQYMEIEEIYFKVLVTREVDHVLQHQKEIGLVRELRYELERELVKKTGITRSPWKRRLTTLWQEVGERIRAAGPYEENNYYFEYFLLDLLYKTSFRQHIDRVACFEEMIGAVQCFLNWSHESAHLLHRKATPSSQLMGQFQASQSVRVRVASRKHVAKVLN